MGDLQQLYHPHTKPRAQNLMDSDHLRSLPIATERYTGAENKSALPRPEA